MNNNELGTIETGVWTEKGFVPISEAQRDGNSPALSVRCSFGRIVASVMRNDDEYNDIAIDLFTDDGRDLQLAVVSCAEACSDNDKPYIMVLPFNGKDDSPFDNFEVSITDDSPWYE